MKILQETERKIEKLYKELGANTAKTVIEYCKQFTKDEKQTLKRVEQGIVTQTEFEQWRDRQLLYSEWSKQMIESIVDLIDETSEMAYDLSEQQVEDAYAEGSKDALEMIAAALVGMAKLDRITTQRLKDAGVTYTVTGKLKGHRIIKPTVKNVKVKQTMYNRHMMAEIKVKNPSLLPAPSDATLRKIRREGLKRWNRKKLNSAIITGIRKGESIPKIAKRLENVANMDKAQALRNARTMVNGARNRGVYHRGQDMEALGFLVSKVWLTARDSRVRDLHKAMEGEEVNLMDEFSNGLRYPADPDGEPAEVYNCRCSMLLNLNGSGMSERDAEELLGL